MRLSMPIGVDDFQEVREGYYFVDKSGFLSDFFPDMQKSHFLRGRAGLAKR